MNLSTLEGKGFLFVDASEVPYALLQLLQDVPTDAPSPVKDYLKLPLLTSRFQIKNSPSHFFIKVYDYSLCGDGIYPGDIAVVERPNNPSAVPGRIVLASLDGEFMLRRLLVEKEEVRLLSSHEDYLPVIIDEFSTFQVYGILTLLISVGVKSSHQNVRV